MLKSYLNKGIIEAGCDEAGRGCLAGPVCAAAVILPENFKNDILNDSKQLTEKQRYALRTVIETEALAWAICFIDESEIDKINILEASYKAMSIAVTKLKINPEHLLIDGNRFKTTLKIPFTCLVKGDARFYSIAAASILAKTYRDDFMLKLHNELPVYNWKQNKGYPTKAHRNAIESVGSSKYHRKSFQLLPRQLEIKF